MSVEWAQSAPQWVLERVALQRGSTSVFDGLSLLLSEPRIGLIGRNGAGKSSLLRLMCGLETPAQGRCVWMARTSPVRTSRRCARNGWA